MYCKPVPFRDALHQTAGAGKNHLLLHLNNIVEKQQNSNCRRYQFGCVMAEQYNGALQVNEY